MKIEREVKETETYRKKGQKERYAKGKSEEREQVRKSTHSVTLLVRSLCYCI
jgi:hypothetical protein